MADVTFVDGTAGSSDASRTISIAKADLTGLADGDFVIVHIGAFAFAATGWSLSGWTQVDYLRTTPGLDVTSAYLYKEITNVAGEPTTWDFLLAGSGDVAQGAVAGAFRGVDAAAYLDAAVTVTSGENDMTPDAPDITTVTDGAMIVTMHGYSYGAAEPTGGAPSTFALGGHIAGTRASNRGGSAMAHKAKAAAGLETIGSWTHTPDNALAEWHVRTIALAPSPSSDNAETSLDTIRTYQIREKVRP